MPEEEATGEDEPNRAMNKRRASPSEEVLVGRITLEPVRMLRDLGQIAEEVISQLGRADADVKITVDIEAHADGGFDEDVRRAVTENARTLHFETNDFEE